MTITGVRNQVLTILIKNDAFVLNTDSAKIKVPKNLAPVKTQLIHASLEALEKSQYVRKVVTADDVFWLFESDISAQEQAVVITPYTADAIANIINQYREAMNIAPGECDKMRITEEDLQSIVVICGQLLNNVEKNKASDGEAEDEEFPNA